MLKGLPKPLVPSEYKKILFKSSDNFTKETPQKTD